MPSKRIYVDLTTAFEERHRIPHGTTRVERRLIEALTQFAGGNISFCRFDARRRQFIAMSREEALAAATTIPVADSRRQPRVATRRIPVIAQLHQLETWFRRSIRDPIRRARGDLIRKTAAAANIFEPGSVLLVPGELHRHDFAQLRGLRRNLGLRLAFLFYDLLDTLPGDDPRAGDPNATKIPGSEFIMREAALILPISDFSAGELRKHAEKRSVQLAPMQTIRLGHQIAGVAPMDGVAGLEPGKFVLSVGDVSPRKNHKLLTGIWSALVRERGTPPIPLVIAGRIGSEGRALMAAVTADPVAAKVIRFLSDVDDARLGWLYRNCRFTLFPSFCEGFGLPVVESLAFGKPCIASDATSIPEASQGLAIHIDPNDLPAWRSAVEKLLDEDDALRRFKDGIATRFRLASWNDTANDVLTAIERELFRPDVASVRASDPGTVAI